jgi:hypothetical protein
MSRRTRVFLSVAGAVLAVGLGVGLVASLLGGELSFVGSRGPAELAHIPRDTRLIAYADVRGVMDSALRRRLSDPTNSGESARRFREATGIDVERDIDHVIAAWSGESAAAAPIVMLNGRFDQGRIEALVLERGGAVEAHGGHRLLVADRNLTVAFVEPGLVVVGTTGAVQRALDVAESGTDVRDNAEIMPLVRDVRDGQVWLVARFDELTVDRLPADLARQLPAITWLSLTGFIDAGVQGRLRVETRDQAAARDLREVIRGFLALARMQAGQQPVLGDLLDSLQLTGQDTTVVLSFVIPPELLDVLGMFRGMQPGAPAPSFPGL